MQHRSAKAGLPATLLCSAALLAACSSSMIAAPPPSVAATSSRAVPAAIRQLPLTDQAGRTVDLASWPGKTVILVPFLTLCTDICPLTTGNLVQTERSLQRDGAASKVQIVELSVDPGRDSAARLAAYAKLTGASWELVTETPATLTAAARYFGFSYQKVPEDSPPSIDWWTGRPLTYDVNHSDGFVIINPHGVERVVSGGAPRFQGKLDPTLQHFLSPLGHQHLRNPGNPNWTPAELLQAVSWSMQVPLASSAS